MDLPEDEVRSRNSSRNCPVPDFAMDRMFDRFKNPGLVELPGVRFGEDHEVLEF